MKLSNLITSTALALVLSAGAAMAQATTAPVTKQPETKSATTAPATKTAKVKKPKKAKAATTRSAISLACSAEANAKNLHGLERVKFRRTCKAQKKKAVN